MNEAVGPKRTEARQLVGTVLMAVIFGLAIWNLIISLMENVVTPWLGTVMGQSAALPPSFTKNYDYPDLFIAVLEFCMAGIVAVSLNWFLQRPGRRAKPRAIAPAAVPASTAVPVATQATARQPAAPTNPPVAYAPPASAEAPGRSATRYVAPPALRTEPVVTSAAKPEATPIFRQITPSAAVPVPQPVTREPAPPAVRPVEKPVSAATEVPKPNKIEVTKPKKEKQVYYNIVGEPVSFDED